MERNEMLGHIVSMLAYCEGKGRPETAENILFMMEKLGMAPPKHEPFPGSDWAFESREWEKKNAKT